MIIGLRSHEYVMCTKRVDDNNVETTQFLFLLLLLLLNRICHFNNKINKTRPKK